MAAEEVEPPLEDVALDVHTKAEIAFDPALSLGSDVDHECPGGDTRLQLPRLDAVDPIPCGRKDLSVERTDENGRMKGRMNGGHPRESKGQSLLSQSDLEF